MYHILEAKFPFLVELYIHGIKKKYNINPKFVHRALFCARDKWPSVAPRSSNVCRACCLRR